MRYVAFIAVNSSFKPFIATGPETRVHLRPLSSSPESPRDDVTDSDDNEGDASFGDRFGEFFRFWEEGCLPFPLDMEGAEEATGEVGEEEAGSGPGSLSRGSGSRMGSSRGSGMGSSGGSGMGPSSRGLGIGAIVVALSEELLDPWLLLSDEDNGARGADIDGR